MSSPVESYWGPDFPAIGDSAPVSVLKQQAEKLTEITGGLVEGVVKESAEAGTVYASLYAGVPAVGDYQFKILYVAHPVVVDPANPFPITVEDSFGHEKRKFPDMPSFDQYLRDLLLSTPVRTAIGNLIKYSKSRAAS
jgi:hypothetical protein